ncbi:MAG: heme lyase CcmF/NrfE family subunit [Deltaproteobacteria bacterium]|nr:heme lyase CcmF/NrfE family subunit [Deltaproteobacteria bacterium]
MLIEIGRASLNIVLVMSVYVIVASLLGVFKKDLRFVASARRGIYSIFILATVSSAILLHAFITNNFAVKYVAGYSERDLNIHYKIAAFWGGNDGSLLFWIFGLSIFAALMSFQNRKDDDHKFIPYTYVVIMVVMIFFLILTSFITNPFDLYPGGQLPRDGRGLNPMLQTFGMMFHPPALLWGYVAFTIPFAFAVAALITRELDSTWILKTRKWTLFAWVLLGIGNIMGAEWAYDELGWGGFWAWDPVENASFIPWLTATAYLHSVMIQERRNMLKIWNMFLIVITFALTIFGTFLVRSGVLQSVHDFGVSEMGPFFIVFMAIMSAIAFGLIIYRYDDLKSDNNQLESFLSRESTFLLNNLILLALAFATLWGTLFPLISEVITGNKITVGPPFFEQVNTPLFLILLIITGICPLIGWRKASAENLKRNFILPAIFMVAALVLLAALGMRHIYAILCFSFSSFVLVTIFMEYYRGIRARGRLKGEGPVKALAMLFWKNKRRYGGYFIHIGIVLVFIGATGSSAFVTENAKSMKLGESMSVGNYTLKYEKIKGREKPNYEAIVAFLSVFKDGKKVDEITPEKRFYYKFPDEPTSEVALSRTLKEDLFVILASFERDGTITVKALINPLINWMWIGAVIAVIGGFYVLLPDGKKKRSTA